MSNLSMKRCKHCNKNTQHISKSTSHILHLILTVCTLGAWVFVWILCAMSNGMSKQCSECGKGKGLLE